MTVQGVKGRFRDSVSGKRGNDIHRDEITSLQVVKRNTVPGCNDPIRPYAVK